MRAADGKASSGGSVRVTKSLEGREGCAGSSRHAQAMKTAKNVIVAECVLGMLPENADTSSGGQFYKVKLQPVSTYPYVFFVLEPTGRGWRSALLSSFTLSEHARAPVVK